MRQQKHKINLNRKGKSLGLALLLGLLFMFIGQIAGAQSYKMRTHPEVPTVPADRPFVDSLIQIADSLRFVDILQTILILQEAIQRSKELNYVAGTADATMKLGLVYFTKGEYHVGARLIQSVRTECFSDIPQGERLKALWYNNASISYTNLGQNDSAISLVSKGLDIASRIQDTALIIRSYINMGAIWINNQMIENALHYLKKAEALSLQTTEKPWLPMIFLNLASAYTNQDMPEAQYEYARKAVEIAQSSRDIKPKSGALRILGFYYMEKGDYEQSLSYYDQALQLCDTNNHHYIYLTLTNISRVYLKMGNLAKATLYGTEAFRHSEQTNLREKSLAFLYQHLAELYKQNKNFPLALDFQNAYVDLALELADIERNKALDRLEVNNRLAEKNQVIAENKVKLLEQQNHVKNRNLWLLLISIVTCSLVVIFFNYFRGAKKKLQILRQEAEINELKAMMRGEEKERNRMAKELHDGVGGLLSAAAINLNTLADKGYPIQQEPEFRKTEMLIDEVSKEVRKAAHNLMPDVLLHHNLPEAVKIFCSNTLKENSIRFEVIASGFFDRLNPDFVLSSYRIIQELIQNILKHAEASEVLVQLQKIKDVLSITVEDNGKGFDTTKKTTGIGLNNIATRVKSYSGKLSIESTAGIGTSVYIEFEQPSRWVVEPLMVTNYSSPEDHPTTTNA